MVSPMPSESRMPNAVALLIVPWNSGPASVTPRCSGQSPRSASRRYALTMMIGSLCLTEILKSWKSCSSNRLGLPDGALDERLGGRLAVLLAAGAGRAIRR